MTILLTGASGFIGHYFLQSNKEHRIVTASVRYHAPLPSFDDIDAVVHLSGLAHQSAILDEQEYLTSNAELTRNLAVAAKQAGVPHFIFISSVKVYGDKINTVADENTGCVPDDAYGKSKLLAEQYLTELSDETFGVSIVRPPLVYGAGVKGNMLKLLQLSQRKIPLPFKNINNKRSVVFAGNLIALIDTLINKKLPGIFIAGDRLPVSTGELIAGIRKCFGKEPDLIRLPAWIQGLLRRYRRHLYTRLFDSFVIDNTVTNNRLNFHPPYSTEEGIAEMVRWYQKKGHE